MTDMTDRPAVVPAQTSSSTTAAYVRIYEEEQPRLVAYARSLTRNSWAAEDLVAEAHFRVWRRLAAGHEIENVPAYLMTTVRHLASSVASATHETPRDPHIPEQATGPAYGSADDDPAERVSSVDLLARVLGELPERWVRALWLADAEGQPLETVGRQIGAKQGATAVLLHRAREGMRQAFLKSQTEAPEDPACEVHWVRMPAYVRGNATARQSERLLAHVDACEGCRGRLAVLIRANDRLPALAGPALLVFVVAGGGAGKVLAWVTAGSASATVTGLGSGSAAGGPGGLLQTARTAGPKAKASLAAGTAAAAAIAVVLALGVDESPATVTQPEKAPVAQGPVVGPSTGAVAPGGEEPERIRTGPVAAVVAEGPFAGARGAGAPVRGENGAAGTVVTEPGGSTTPGEPSTPSEPSTPVDGGAVGEPVPVDPTPVDPTPVDPSPVEPAPVDPSPVEPAPEEPSPSEPKPAEPKPADPAPTDPEPANPKPSEPTPSEPKPADPKPTYPKPVEEAPEEPPVYEEPPTDSTPPSGPDVPETPSTPETPTTPDTPSAPETPTTPETPEAPTTPEPPTASEPPATPETPTTPTTPPAPSTTPQDPCAASGTPHTRKGVESSSGEQSPPGGARQGAGATAERSAV